MEELKFKIIADSKGVDSTMKSVARSTDGVAKSGEGANHSLKHLIKTFVGLGTGAESAAGAFKTLARLGTAGIITAAAAEAVNKFGEAIKENAQNYYETNKSLAESFDQGLKSTSVEQADSALKSVNDRLEKIREEELKFSPFQAMLKVAEKLTGQDFGTHNLEKAKKFAEEERDALEEVVATRIKERDISEGTSGSIKGLERVQKSNKILITQSSMMGRARKEQVDLAQEEANNATILVGIYEEQLAQLNKINDGQRNQKLYQEALDKLADSRVQKEQSLLNLQKAQRAEGDKSAQAQKQFGGGLLGASASGKVAMEVAQKQRERQVKQENFRTQEAYFQEQAKAENARRIAKGLSGGLTAGDMKAREAEKVAAASAPTLAEQAQAQATGMSAEQVAIANVAQRQAVASGMQAAPKEETRDAWKGELTKTMKTMIDTLNSLMSAPLVTSGAGGS
jgi:hypothetical protein